MNRLSSQKPTTVLTVTNPPLPTLPTDLAIWLGRLLLLQGVPFNYLVPDSRMLPPESIRFFQVDANWMQSLMDGAFSLGSSTAGDGQLDGDQLATVQNHGLHASNHHRDAIYQRTEVQSLMAQHAPPSAAAPPLLSGFLLLSGVVQGWPGLEVVGLDSTGDGANILKILRFERLTPSLLLVIFQGLVQKVLIHEPQESLHFGVDPPTDPEQPVFFKTLKYLTDSNLGQEIPTAQIPVPMRAGNKLVVRLNDLAQAMPPALTKAGGMNAKNIFTTAEFALEMVAGVQQVAVVNAPDPQS